MSYDLNTKKKVCHKFDNTTDNITQLAQYYMNDSPKFAYIPKASAKHTCETKLEYFLKDRLYKKKKKKLKQIESKFY